MPQFDVLVFDNASSDESNEELERVCRNHGEVTLIRSAENLGFGAGVNAAVAQLNGSEDDALWIVNPDVDITRCDVRDLVGVLDRERGIGSPVIVSGNADQIWFAGGSVDFRRMRTPHSFYGQARHSVSGLRTTDFVSGAALLTHLGTFRTLGGFDSRLFLYWEDFDLSRRAAGAGHRLWVAGDSTVWHREGGSGAGSGDRSSVFYYYFMRNRLRLSGAPFRRWDIAFGRGLRETLSWLATPWLTLDTTPSKKTVAAVRGIRDGLRGKP